MWILWIVIAVLAFVALNVFFYFVPVGLWISALAAGVPVGPLTFIGMRLRKVNPHRVINPMIAAWKAGIKLSVSELEAHYLAGGNVERVVRALISADKAGIPLTFKRAAAIDLAGRDVYDAVAMSVNPRVIQTPKVSAVAKDGIELMAIARVTVRANIDRLVGGATEETVIARVGEGIVSAIGSANSYKEVLENPDSISKLVLSKGLDAGTAFEILSIDIADIDVGRNIGAEFQAAQAEADLKVARAQAEVRRAQAVAREQEMKALVWERRAAVVEAEAEIPRAIAEAFRKGHLGIMDYYRLRNIQADTQMRERLARGEKPRLKSAPRREHYEPRGKAPKNPEARPCAGHRACGDRLPPTRDLRRAQALGELGRAIREVPGGVELRIHVQPGASRTEFAGLFGEALKLRVAAPAQAGKANEALREFLAQLFDVSESRVVLVRGRTSREKVVRLEGLGLREVQEILSSVKLGPLRPKI